MQTKQSLEALRARFEELVLQGPDSTLSEAHRGRIAAKFASKSLKELTEIVGQLRTDPPDCQE